MNDLGRLVLKSGKQDFLESLVLQIKRYKEIPHLVLIKLDTDRNNITLEIKEIGKKTVVDYLWVGNADGANSPQWYVTTNRPEYLLSQTIPNLIAKLPDISSLREQLKRCQEMFYVDLGKQKGADERYRYIVNLQYIDWDKTTQGIHKESGKIKKTVRKVTSKFYDFVKKETALTRKEAVLFSLVIDGNPLVLNKEYRNLVVYEKVDSLYDKNVNGLCSVCGLVKPVTSNTTRLKFKYYNTDKINFAHGLDRHFATNLCLCSQCYKHILAAEVLVIKDLSVQIGAGSAGLPLYIIPGFLFGFNLGFSRLEDWLKSIRFNFETMATLDSKLTNLEKQLGTHRDYKAEEDNYVINLLFYQRVQAELKVLNLIQDVPPSRLTAIREVTAKVHDLGNRLLGESQGWSLDFNKIYYLFPPRVKNNAPAQYRQLLSIYDSIFTGDPLNYTLLMNKFLELVQLYHYKRFKQYKLVRPRDVENQLVRTVLQANLFLIYANRLGIMVKKGGAVVDASVWQVDKDVKEYVQEVGYDEPRAGLFLLGCLVGEVASAQYNDGKKTKPILNKLNYQGMDMRRIMILYNEVFEKLLQYKKLSLTVEALHGQLKSFLDKHCEDWPLNHQENVFYLLSGYAFNTHRIIRRAVESGGKRKEGGMKE